MYRCVCDSECVTVSVYIGVCVCVCVYCTVCVIWCESVVVVFWHPPLPQLWLLSFFCSVLLSSLLLWLTSIFVVCLFVPV